MKNARKTLCAMIVVIALCAMLVMPVSAAETGNLWLNAAGAQQNTTIVVCADTTVTNGMVELHYDASQLTYKSVTVSDKYVAKVAVNTDTEGVVKIAWVAPGYYEADKAEMALITVRFEGVTETDEVAVTGNVYDAEGQLVNIISAPVKDPDNGNADTGDTIQPVIAMLLLSAAAMTACLVSNKKGWWAK